MSAPRRVVDRLVALQVVYIVAANAIGAAIVAALLLLLVPIPTSQSAHRGAIALASAIYLAVALLIGVGLGLRLQRRIRPWLTTRRPTADEARRALRIPIDIATISGVLWLVGAVALAVVTAVLSHSTPLGVQVMLAVLLGGLAVTGIAYLLAERVSRPVTIEALRERDPDRRMALGVAPRLLLTWLLTSGVPVLGLLLLALNITRSATKLRPGAVLLLTSIALGAGALAMALSVRAINAPMRGLRRAVQRVGQGDYDVHIPIDDAGEIGQLQDGVNAMTAGLAEREKLRDLFGRHVGPQVARRALESGVELGGERLTAAALFVDVVGSTRLSVDHDPEHTVGVLNRFFAVVVEAVERNGGLVNKFQGDAALCVFGAPVTLDDPAGSALRAAREMAERIQAAEEVGVGVGVAYGTVVAGQVGAAQRLEYTVIGDAVNEAARLTDLAKQAPGHVLASGDAVAAADPAEREHWREHERVVVRGRTAETTTWVVQR